jgi:hypothetical protein
MTCDFRVVKQTTKHTSFDEPTITYSIHEVCYDESHNVSNVSPEPARLIASNHLDLYDIVGKIEVCLNKKTVIFETGEEEV